MEQRIWCTMPIFYLHSLISKLLLGVGVVRNGLFLIILVMALVSSEVKAEERGSIVVDGVAVFISPGTSFCVSDNVTVTQTGKLANSGIMWFANTEPIDLTFAGINKGDGQFVFSGSSDCFLQGKALWNKVSMSTNGGDLVLDGDLTVSNMLELNAGIIDARYAKLSLTSSFANNLLFDNKEESTSYILGSLIRTVALDGGNYYFPVGDEIGFHPFLAQNPSAKGYIEVSYDSEISNNMASAFQSSSSVVANAGGWEVDAAVDFYSGLSLFNRDGTMLDNSVQYNTLYAANDASTSSDYRKISASVTHRFYSLATEKTSGGTYTISSDKDLELVNFIYVTGNSSARFEIPDLSRYTKVELVVYNRWGLQIYEDHNYQNGFDCSLFPQGTYFYELKLHEGTAVRLVRNFIEIKRGK